MHSTSIRLAPIRAAFAGLVLTLSPAALAQTPNDAALTALAETTRQAWNSPAAGMMQIRDGEVRIGVAGLRVDGEIEAVTPDDLWHIGSNTKSITATLVARLAERGEISWDDTVGELLGGHVDTIDPGFRDVTFRHLLSHHSGAPANIGMMHMIRFRMEGVEGRPMPEQRLDYAGHILSQPPAHEPGTRFVYSNAGYVIAGAMLEQALGEPWEVLVEREVMTPLGIDDFGFGAPGSADRIDQPRGHRNGLFGNLVAMTGGEADNPPVLGPAGTLHISLPGYARYLQAHIDGARGEDGDFLSAQSWALLHTAPFQPGYAMGWGLGSDALQHSGSNTLWVMHTVLVPEQQLGAVIVTNRAAQEPAGPVFRQIVELE
jgi:CubicO group peptidase (beta-lactamase class C family)